MTEGSVEGGLQIDLDWHRGRVAQVAISSTRPLQMPRIFFGKSPAEVLSTLPRIYSICGIAQGCAAVEALEQALALSVSLTWWKRRRLLVAFETIKEHLWRIELDWAKFLNHAPDRNGVTQLVSLMSSFRTILFPEAGPFTLGGSKAGIEIAQLTAHLDKLEQLLESRLFSQPTQRWLKISDRQDLTQWSRRQCTLAQQMLFQVEKGYQAGFGQNPIAPLAELEPNALNQRLTGADADRYIAQPDWQGTPAETTPYTRRRDHPMLRSLEKLHGNGLLPRLAARLVELAVLVGEIRSGIVSLENDRSAGSSFDAAAGIGISQIEAARGRLVHRVELKAGVVTNYQILAPTEWNFHPGGVLASGLAGMEADNEASLKQNAELLINAVDPCVGYRLRINGTEYRE